MKIFANFARSEGIGRDRSITFLGGKKKKKKIVRFVRGNIEREDKGN